VGLYRAEDRVTLGDNDMHCLFFLVGSGADNRRLRRRSARYAAVHQAEGAFTPRKGLAVFVYKRQVPFFPSRHPTYAEGSTHLCARCPVYMVLNRWLGHLSGCEQMQHLVMYESFYGYAPFQEALYAGRLQDDQESACTISLLK